MDDKNKSALSTTNYFRLYAAFGGSLYRAEYDPLATDRARDFFFSRELSPLLSLEHQVALASIAMFKHATENTPEQNMTFLNRLGPDDQLQHLGWAQAARIYSVCAGVADPEKKRPLSLGDGVDKIVSETALPIPSREHLIATVSISLFRRLAKIGKVRSLDAILPARENIQKLLAVSLAGQPMQIGHKLH